MNNYIYAKVSHGIVVDIITSESDKDLSHNTIDLTLVDITNTNIKPKHGWIYHNGKFSPATANYMQLATAKKHCRREIDTAAGNARNHYMTDICGQSEIYREKYDQAIDYLSELSAITDMSQIDINDYPLLVVDSMCFNMNIEEAANQIISRRTTWIIKMAEIERIRLQGKLGLEVCNTTHECHTLAALCINKLHNLT